MLLNVLNSCLILPSPPWSLNKPTTSLGFLLPVVGVENSKVRAGSVSMRSQCRVRELREVVLCLLQDRLVYLELVLCGREGWVFELTLDCVDFGY